METSKKIVEVFIETDEESDSYSSSSEDLPGSRDDEDFTVVREAGSPAAAIERSPAAVLDQPALIEPISSPVDPTASAMDVFPGT